MLAAGALPDPDESIHWPTLVQPPSGGMSAVIAWILVKISVSGILVELDLKRSTTFPYWYCRSLQASSWLLRSRTCLRQLFTLKEQDLACDWPGWTQKVTRPAFPPISAPSRPCFCHCCVSRRVVCHSLPTLLPHMPTWFGFTCVSTRLVWWHTTPIAELS